MGRTEILSVLQGLAMSQGFYGKLLEQLTNGSEKSENYLTTLVEQKFQSVLDLVFYLEC